MNFGDPNTAQSELVIVRRRGGRHGDGHHGGVWKIAFADFMTAMMAFFLVMWLINAANDETRSQVASYFNPVKLTDAVSSPKGVRKMDSTSRSSQTEGEVQDLSPVTSPDAPDSEGKNVKAGDESESGERNFAEQSLFKDPYAVLSEIAGDAGQGQPIKAEPAMAGGEAGLAGGEAFRDPFDPASWQQAPSSAEAAADDPEDAQSGGDGFGFEQMADGSGGEDESQGSGATAAADRLQQAPQEAAEAEDEAPQQTRAEALKAELMAAAHAAEAASQPSLSVETTKDGLLVSLTDKTDFGMFSLASAKPTAELIRLMERLAAVLASRSGNLVIRGHTDGRPFRSETYDNWRLSTARAHMAYHMLVRGGIDEKRITRIEGRADRDLKVPDDPHSAQNRRIEILLQEADR